MRLERTLIAMALLGVAATGWTQGWSPQRNVEIVAGFPPGGGVDKTARTLERILVADKLLKSPVTVVNKPGGGQNIAFIYVSQRPPDGHTLIVGTKGMLINHIRGSSRLNYTDFTPIASLFNEYIAFSLNMASPIRTGKVLIERLRKDPKSVTIGFAAIGGGGHVAAALLNKAIGGNARDLKVVAFKGSADAIANLLGGHIDLISTPVVVAAPYAASGQLRIVAVAAPKRLGGALADIPTWREHGVEPLFVGWRGVLGPKGMTAAQSAYWENALRKVTETAEWKTDLEQNFRFDDFVTGGKLKQDLAKDYADTNAVLVDLGLAKQ